MISRHGPCIGIALFRFLRWKVELWHVPAEYICPKHSHRNASVEILFLWARSLPGSRTTRDFGARSEVTESRIFNTPLDWFKFYSVRAGVPHSFGPSKHRLVYLTFQTWRKDCKVTSIAEDFNRAYELP